jgi:adenylate kinase
MNKVEKFDQT